MRLFHHLIFDEKLENFGGVDSRPTYGRLLAAAKQISLFIIADPAAGASPTIDVRVYESPDQLRWKQKSAVVSQALSTTEETVLIMRDVGSMPTAGFMRVAPALNENDAKARIRIWATGRGVSPKILPVLPELEGFGWSGVPDVESSRSLRSAGAELGPEMTP